MLDKEILGITSKAHTKKDITNEATKEWRASYRLREGICKSYPTKDFVPGPYKMLS